MLSCTPWLIRKRNQQQPAIPLENQVSLYPTLYATSYGYVLCGVKYHPSPNTSQLLTPDDISSLAVSLHPGVVPQRPLLKGKDATLEREHIPHLTTCSAIHTRNIDWAPKTGQVLPWAWQIQKSTRVGPRESWPGPRRAVGEVPSMRHWSIYDWKGSCSAIKSGWFNLNPPKKRQGTLSRRALSIRSVMWGIFETLNFLVATFNKVKKKQVKLILIIYFI